jgi:hypothetical protein
VSAAALAACKELAVGFAALTYGGNRNLPVAALMRYQVLCITKYNKTKF